MEELDSAIDVNERYVAHLLVQKARNVKALKEAELNMEEELEDVGNQLLRWIWPARAYMEYSKNVRIIDESIISTSNALIKDVQSIVAHVEKEKERNDDLEARNNIMEEQLSKSEKEVVELRRRLKKALGRVGEIDHYVPNDLPKAGAILSGDDAYAYLQKQTHGITTLLVLIERRNINFDDLPHWIPHADEETDYDRMSGKYPKHWGRGRQKAETLIENLGPEFWRRPDFKPLTRHVWPRLRSLPVQYAACDSCCRVFLKDFKGKTAEREDEIGICVDCEARRDKITEFNHQSEERGNPPVDPITGIELDRLADIVGNPTEAMDYKHTPEVIKRWLAEKGYKNQAISASSGKKAKTVSKGKNKKTT